MGSIKVGSTAIKKVYVGSNAIKKVYVGSTLIWSSFNGVSGSLSTFAAIKAAMQAGGWIYWTESNFPATTKTVKTVTDSNGIVWTLTMAARDTYGVYYHTLKKGDTGMPGDVGGSVRSQYSSATDTGAPLGMAPSDDGAVFLYKVSRNSVGDYSYEITKTTVSDDGSSSSSQVFKP